MHLIDELTLFLALPRRTEGGQVVEYALGATDGEQETSLEPDELLAALDEGFVALALRSGGELSAVRERIGEIEAQVKTDIEQAIDEEIDYWLEPGRTLVAGAFADARDEVRERIRRRIDDLSYNGKLTLRHQFRTHRGLRRLLRFDTGVGYQDAMRTGLDHAARVGGGAPAVVSRAAAAFGWFGIGGMAAAAGAVLTITTALAVVIVLLLNDGKDGRDGATWLAGSAPPDEAGVGAVGDFYFDQTDAVVWSRTEDGWTEVAALRGRDGPSWHVGDGRPTDDLGEVRDLYLDRVAGDVWARTTEGWTEPVANLRGRDGRTWYDGDTEPVGDLGVDGDFHLDRCRGVVSARSDGRWLPVVDLAGTQGPMPPAGCTRPVEAGDNLWAIVERECRPTSNRATARAVSESWLASLDVIGGDPDQIDASQPLLIRCD